MADYPFPKAVDFENLSAKAKKAFNPEGWVIQPKWDGCALVVEIRNNCVWSVESASGKPVYSCDHIAEYIAKWVGNGRYAMEAWRPCTPFQDISGMFRTHAPQPLLSARIFDGYVEGSSADTYFHRLTVIHSQLGFGGLVQSAWGMGEKFTTWDDAWTKAKFWQAQGGYDGCILRDPLSLWTEGRSKGDIVKLKPLMDWDLRVTHVKTAIGDKTGRPTVALGCAWKDGQIQYVATGLNHEQQAAPDRFIGSIVTVRGMGLTTDGFIREPRFITVRDDKVEADY